MIGTIEEGPWQGKRIIIPNPGEEFDKDSPYWWIEVNPSPFAQFIRCCLIHEVENIPDNGCPKCLESYEKTVL